jgi:hypothetical protein
MGMELLAAAAQQGAVSCVLHQRVLEGVFGRFVGKRLI